MKIVKHVEISKYLILFLFIWTIQFVSCQENKHTMNTEEQMRDEPNEIWPTNKDEKGDYYYKTSICSFPGYITENAGSHFVANNESIGFIIMRNDPTAWPSITTSGLNDEHHPIPQKLYVAYYSLQEDKFYEGLFDLPYEELKKDFEKIWKEYPNKSLYMADKFNRYSDFIVGVAPEGNIVVWLSSYISNDQKIIGTYKAKVTNSITWEDFRGMNGMGAGNTKENYTRNINKDSKIIPIGKVVKYAKRYNWKAKIESNSQTNISLNKLYIKYFNGENESVYQLYKPKNEIKNRAVPKTIIFEFYLDGKDYSGGFDFKEDDIYKAFDELSNSKDEQFEIITQLDKNNKIAKIVLQNKDQSYVLDAYDIVIDTTPIDESLEIKPLIE